MRPESRNIGRVSKHEIPDDIVCDQLWHLSVVEENKLGKILESRRIRVNLTFVNSNAILVCFFNSESRISLMIVVQFAPLSSSKSFIASGSKSGFSITSSELGILIFLPYGLFLKIKINLIGGRKSYEGWSCMVYRDMLQCLESVATNE